MIVVLNDEIMNKVCKFGMGKETCRYLGAGPEGFICFKHDAGLAGQINERIKNETFIAQGDNCPGILVAKMNKENSE